jgi:hypothetical protein
LRSAGGQRPDVVLGARRQLVALLDALEAGAEHDREGQVRVVAESIERTSTRAEFGLPKAGTRTSAERLRWPQLTNAGDSVIRLGSCSGKSRL